MRVSDAAVELLERHVEPVELHRQRVGVGEEHDERARADAEPCVSACDEDDNRDHDDDDDCAGYRAAQDRGAHALGVGAHDVVVGLVEDLSLVGLASVRLYREDVGDRVGELAGERVLRRGGLLVEREQALEEPIDDDDVDDEKHREDAYVDRDDREKQADREDRRAYDRDDRVDQALGEDRVCVHELLRLADERASEPVRMEGHRLVGERVERLRGEEVGRLDLELPCAVVLELAAHLPDDVGGDERGDVWAEDLEDLAGVDVALRHDVDDLAEHQGAHVGEEEDEAERRHDREQEHRPLDLRHLPVVMDRSERCRALLLLCHPNPPVGCVGNSLALLPRI